MAIPKLPGFVLDHPEAEPKPKSQSLHWKNGYSVVESVRHHVEQQQPPPTHPPGQCTITTARSTIQQPKWLRYSNCVLRFYGYCTENSPDNSEMWTVRKVTILHYLEDDTTKVTMELRDDDHGTGGVLAARRHIPLSTVASGDVFIGPDDLRVGSPITVHGRVITVCDADEFTRNFYDNERKAPQPPAVPIPISPMDVAHEQMKKGSGLSRCDPQSPTRFAETLLGRAPSTKKLQQFLEGNSHVLRYYAIPHGKDGESLPGTLPKSYKILYYLEDDTVEIQGLRHHSSSANNDVARFFARALLPKYPKGILPLGSEPSRDSCIAARDLRIGCILDAYGKKLFVYDADSYTKQWCKDNLGCCDEELAPIDISVPAPSPIKQQLPPHNGFGDPEETAKNCQRLVPLPSKHIQRYHHGILDVDRIVLRFAAKLVQQAGRVPLSKVDVERTLVVSYYMADGTLSMYEPVVPNSGIVGGKFLQRCKAYTTMEKICAIDEKDLYIGAVIEIFGRAIMLIDADDFTWRIMEEDAHTFPKADGHSVLKRIFTQNNKPVSFDATEADAAKDPAVSSRDDDISVQSILHQKACGRLTKNEFVDAIKVRVPWLSEHEIVAVERKLSREGLAALDAHSVHGR